MRAFLAIAAKAKSVIQCDIFTEEAIVASAVVAGRYCKYCFTLAKKKTLSHLKILLIFLSFMEATVKILCRSNDFLSEIKKVIFSH